MYELPACHGNCQPSSRARQMLYASSSQSHELSESLLVNGSNVKRVASLQSKVVGDYYKACPVLEPRRICPIVASVSAKRSIDNGTPAKDHQMCLNVARFSVQG